MSNNQNSVLEIQVDVLYNDSIALEKFLRALVRLFTILLMEINKANGVVWKIGQKNLLR